MKTLIYSTKDFEIPFLEAANKNVHAFSYVTERLTSDTARLAIGFDAISIFSADDASSNVLEKLRDFGVRYITLRSAGYDNIRLFMAEKFGMKVANAPDYSPNAVAEHAVGLVQAINRKIVLADKQLQVYDFTISNLIGVDLLGKTVGIVGMGKIGRVIAKIMHGFGCTILASDPEQNAYIKSAYNVRYTDILSLCKQSDVIVLSAPLNTQTYQLIDQEKIAIMKTTAILVNVARGAIVCTESILDGLDSNALRGYAADVYEKESGVFFYDRSSQKPNDPLLERLMHHSKVVLTPHQAFATQEAIKNIATTTVYNLTSWEQGNVPKNQLDASKTTTP